MILFLFFQISNDKRHYFLKFQIILICLSIFHIFRILIWFVNQKKKKKKKKKRDEQSSLTKLEEILENSYIN